MNDYIDEKKTGYPSIDKPWLKYYTESARNSRLSSKTMYKYLFDKNAEHMDQTALLYFGRNISYKELIENIKRAASSFYKMGVRKGDVVSFCTVTVPEVIYSFYGLNMIGAIGNMIDPRTSVEGIAEYIKESNSKYLIILDVLQSRLKELISNENIKKAIVISPADSMPGVMSFFYKLAKHYNIIENKCVIWKDFINIGKDFPFEGRPYEKGLPVSIMHTGGTTGNPKGVLFSDDGYNHLNDEFAHYRMEPKRGEIFLNIMPPFIAYGMAVGIHEMLCCGSKVVLIPRFDPEKFDSLIIKYKPQHFWGVAEHILKYKYKPIVIGFDNFLETKCGPVIIAPNHIRTIDPLIIESIIKKNVHWVALKRFFEGQDSIFNNSKNRILCTITKRLFEKLHYFPIERKKDNENVNNLDAVKDMNLFLNNGFAIGIFPEATTRKKDGCFFGDFNTTFVKLAVRNNARIQPVLLYWLEKKSKHRVIVNFGKPILADRDRNVEEIFSEYMRTQRKCLLECETYVK